MWSAYFSDNCVDDRKYEFFSLLYHSRCYPTRPFSVYKSFNDLNGYPAVCVFFFTPIVSLFSLTTCSGDQ